MRKILAIFVATISLIATSTSAQAQQNISLSAPTDIPSVHIIAGSDINLLSSSSAIPIRIQNDFDVDVRIHVHAVPDSGRISVPGAIEVTIPAQTTITAKLPVTATGVGNVNLLVWLETFSGLSLGSKAELHINVNPSAEGTFVVVFTASVIALLSLGVVRTIRRRKASAK